MDGKDVKTIRERTKKVKIKDRIMAILLPFIVAIVACIIVYFSMKIFGV